MIKLPVPLKVAIMDAEDEGLSARALRAAIEGKSGVTDVQVFGQIQNPEDMFRRDKFNCLFIDIFNIGETVTPSISFIELVRIHYPMVAFCLYSSPELLKEMPEVNDRWKKRFGHYIKLGKDPNIRSLKLLAEERLLRCSRWIQSNVKSSKVDIPLSHAEQRSMKEALADREEEITFLRKQLGLQRKIARHFEQAQVKRRGDEIKNIFELEDAREKIKSIKAALRTYNIEIEDLPSDKEP